MVEALSLKKGSPAVYKGEPVTVDRPTGADEVLVLLPDGNLETVPVADLAPPHGDRKADPAKPIDRYENDELDIARDHKDIIEPLLSMRGSKAEKVQELVKQYGYSRATIYRWLRKYEETGRLSALAPNRARKRKKRIDPRVEAIISGIREKLYLNKRKVSATFAIEEIRRRCHLAKLKPPQLNAPFSRSASADRLQLQLLEVLPKAQTRMIIVDEVHNVLIARRREQDEYFQLLKFLSNELGLVIVGIGTVEALRAMQTDQQIGNRFEPYRLERWEANEDFVKFLTGLADAMNIKRTMVFKKKSVLNKIWDMSEGLTGEAKKIVAKAVALTFEEGHETLTPEVFAKIGWVSPGERRMSASRR